MNGSSLEVSQWFATLQEFTRMTPLHLLALLACTAARLAGSVRVSETEGELVAEEGGERLVVPDASDICGGTEIWQVVAGSGNDPLEQALNVDWGLAKSYKDAHITEQKAAVEKLTKQLEGLEKRLAKAEQEESLPWTGPNQHKALLDAGLGEESFKGADQAYNFGCAKRRKGLDGERKPQYMRRGAYNNAKVAFEKNSNEFFEKKEYRLSWKSFLDECNALITKKDTDKESFCGNLCQDFLNMAKSHSNQAVGAVAGISNKLKSQIEKVKQELEDAEEHLNTCETDWSSLSGFQETMAGLTKIHDTCHEAVRAAYDGYEDLTEEMEDLEVEVEAEMEKFKKAADKLTSSDKRVQSAKTALEKATAEESTLAGQIEEVKGKLNEISDELSSAAEANDKVADLKKKVTATMMLMMQLVDNGLREPLQNLGFSEDPEDLEVPDPRTLEAAGVLKDALTEMQTYCKDTAMPAFTELKSQLDLTSLCGFGATDTLFDDLATAVEKRTEKMKKELTMVVDWLNPWKVLKKLSMDQGREKEEALVKEGQLMYLEQVKAIFISPKNAFFPYLINWRKGGSHHALILKLKDTVEELKKKETLTKVALGVLNKAWENAQKSHKDAEASLEQAKKAKGLAAQEKKAIQDTLMAMKEKGQKMETDLQAWQDKIDKALKDLAAAKKAIVDTYVSSTSFLEMEDEEEEGADEA